MYIYLVEKDLKIVISNIHVKMLRVKKYKFICQSNFLNKKLSSY